MMNMSQTNNSDPALEPRTVVSGRVDFSASLDTFHGPLDLLLYLIKENEVEIADIPISKILEQYLRFLDQATQWDLQLAGEFLVMAATLMEIKSRELLPAPDLPLEGEEIIEDPRSELVRQLIAYRRLKEQARELEQLRQQWECCRPRALFNDVPEPTDSDDAERDRATAQEALMDVDIYSLFAAYEKILKAVLAQAPTSVSYEGESIEDKITRIEEALKVRPFTRFVDLISEPGNRGDIATTFVALLELVRRRAVRLIQQQDFGSIDIVTQKDGEAEELTRQEAATAEAADEAAMQARAAPPLASQSLEQPDSSPTLPWLKKKRASARPKFEGLVRPEDIEELDAEENEIARRIDAILAAADEISERFELSRDGKIREDRADPQKNETTDEHG
ncbi:MAG: segregation/condensation protein A [Planctomycetota bacterium]